MYVVLVIGAGVSGALCARELSKYRLSVCFVDRSCDAAGGASRANSGIVHAGFDAMPGTLKAKLNVRGCLMMPALTEELGVEYKNIPSLVVCLDEEERHVLDKLYARGVSNGVGNMRIIEKDELRELEPRVSDKAVAALYAGDAGIVCPYGLAIAAAENAVANGADHRFSFEVKSISPTEGGYAVSNGEEILEARYIINAAGLHADEIADMTGDRDFELYARRGEYMLFDRKVSDCVRNVLFTLPSRLGKGILVAPTVDGNLLIGPNAHDVEKDNTEVTSSGLDEVHAGALRLVPTLPGLRSVITSFAGQRPTPSTGDFIIRMSGTHPHVLHLAGIESPGLASSPAVAEYAVGLLREDGLELVPRDDFNPRRSRPVSFRTLDDEAREALIAKNPAYGRIICRCESVTEGEILDAIHAPLGATTIDGVKRRTRAGMGRCQSGFCMPKVAELLARELGVPLDEVKKHDGDSELLVGRTK